MEEKQEKVVEETTKQENPVKEEPKVDNTVEKIKVKKKSTMKKFSQDDKPIKVDLSKPPKTKEDAIQERETEKVHVEEPSGDSKEVGEGGTESSSKETQPSEDESKVEDTPIIEEITDEKVEEKVEKVKEQIKDVIDETEKTGEPLPDSIQKLMDFMTDTGGNLEDYVKLNQDYDNLDENALLREYYKQSKPHLNGEEINFLLEDQFSYDEEVDEERDIKRKQLALKEQVASAKGHLDDLKSKYYEDIKSGSKLTSEQQKAVDFFNRYNKESEENKKATEHSRSIFKKKTSEVFNDKFKGFEYSVGDKKFRFNVKDIDSTKEIQSDINNTVKKFLNENNEIEDAAGYHKSIFTGMHADAVATHFYEQGKADAIKDSIAKSKNIDMDPRQPHGEIQAGGMKFKVLGDDSSDFKFKINKK